MQLGQLKVIGWPGYWLIHWLLQAFDEILGIDLRAGVVKHILGRMALPTMTLSLDTGTTVAATNVIESNCRRERTKTNLLGGKLHGHAEQWKETWDFTFTTTADAAIREGDTGTLRKSAEQPFKVTITSVRKEKSGLLVEAIGNRTI